MKELLSGMQTFIVDHGGEATSPSPSRAATKEVKIRPPYSFGKLLVPVDFSDHSYNAYLFANHLAYQLGYAIHLLYVRSNFGTQKRSHQGTPLESEAIQTKLKSFSRWRPDEIATRLFPVETNIEILNGPIDDRMQEKIEALYCRYVVCGIGNKSASSKHWVDSIPRKLSYLSGAPLILVPKPATFSVKRHLVVVCDQKINKLGMLGRISAGIDNVYDTVHCIRFRSDDMDSTSSGYFESMVFRDMGVPRSKIMQEKGQVMKRTLDLASSILKFINDYDADLMVLIRKEISQREQQWFDPLARAVFARKLPLIVWRT